MHKAEKVRRWFTHHPRHTAHFTPNGESWLSLTQQFLAELTKYDALPGRGTRLADLKKAILDYLGRRNGGSEAFAWIGCTNLNSESVREFL
jgi:hypothetical protein